MAQRIEHLARVYDGLRTFVGENVTFKYGDILYVSTRNNDEYDMIIHADGVHNFLELYRMKQEEAYTPVSDPADLAGLAGSDIRVDSDEVANAFSASSPYFRNVVISGTEVSQSVVVKSTERTTLEGVTISGGKGSTNGKIIYAANELYLRDISAKDGSTLYNAFEGYQTTTDPEYNGISLLVAENLNIDCPSLTHNIINVYTPADNAEIIIRNSKFNLTVDNSNVLRLANYMNAVNVSVTFENCDWTYENGTSFNDWKWAGLAIYQPSASDLALNGDYSRIATWKFLFNNCSYNGTKVKENGFGQHNQVLYMYDLGRTGAVSNPSDIEGMQVTFK